MPDVPLLGCWCRLGAPQVADVVARCGHDWMCLDLQHGLADYRDVSAIADRLAGTATDFYVRVSWKDPSAIMKALDAGAKGTIVPMVETAAEVEEAVRASRYPPEGNRSSAGLGIGGRDTAAANAAVRCGVMIETAASLDHLSEILSVPGLDFVLVGPEDLSLTTGLASSSEDDERERERIFESITSACHSHGVLPGIFCGDAATSVHRAGQGYRFLATSTDLGLIADAAARTLSHVRAGLTESA
jgi:4-hydroxy-2-oxoheptanedioate aldolase